MSILIMFFFFNDTATTEIYTLSLHDALPIFSRPPADRTLRSRRQGGLHGGRGAVPVRVSGFRREGAAREDRKSTRLNSSHANISYAVFCLKKKKKNKNKAKTK